MATMTMRQAAAIMDRYENRLMWLPGVTAIGVERGPTGEPFIAVHVVSDDALALRWLPQTVAMVPIVPEVSGEAIAAGNGVKAPTKPRLGDRIMRRIITGLLG